jgi:uncharacterized protein
MGNTHPAVMFEFIATDQQRLCDFYQAVFGWEFDVVDNFAYIRFAPRAIEMLGGIGQAEPGIKGREPGRNFYLGTDDLSATLAAVERAGGAVYVPVTDIDGYRFAMFTDPEGNVVGLLHTPEPEQPTG